jgi:uncharacterized protein YgiM (DUF1202 family)
MADDLRSPDHGRPTPRYRNVSGRPLNRRVVMRAAAGLSALTAAGGLTTVPSPAPRKAAAQQADGTRAREWYASENAGDATSLMAAGEWVTFQAEFPFWSIGAGWNGDVGTWPIVEIQTSVDGETWGDTWSLTARVDDGGRQSRDGRLFTDLLFGDGEQWVRYRTIDGDGNPSNVAGLMFAYIDPTDGPWDADREERMKLRPLRSADETDTMIPPAIITRQEWGADESYRFDTYGEVWPPEYETVEHAIIHHSGVNYPNDGFLSIRSVYYYHAVTQGWGDIGYNYLVDGNGRTFEGRHGGQNVIGGHSFEYAIGSSGICVIGDYAFKDATDPAKAALAHVVAWTVRDLDPYATKAFHEAPSLPTICAHRDVNQTSCPGDLLYADLQEIRDLVAATLDANDLESPYPGGIVPGDRVQVQTDDLGPLNVRSSAEGTIIGQIPNGTLAWVNDGPITRPSGNWYRMSWVNGTGWVTAEFLIVNPPVVELDPTDYTFGLNLRFTAETNIRARPNTSSGIQATVPRNSWAFVMAGPQAAEGYEWYQVRVYGVSRDGWAIKNNITPAPVDNEPAARFKVGDTVVATDTINVRPRPGLAQTIASTASAGTQMRITVAPLTVTEHIWYGVYSSAFGGGWVAESYLRGQSAPPPSGSTKFVLGDTVRVTEALNLRSGPSTGNAVIAVLSAGTTGKIGGAPRTGNGYTWYQIQTSQGTGWAVQDWLVKTSGTSNPPPPTTPPPTTPPPSNTRFVLGDTVRVTEALNMRTGPSTGNAVIAVLSAGTTGKVGGAPRSGSGYTWYQIQTSQGTGWVVQDWLVKASGSSTPAPAPAPAFANGDRAQVVDGALNMRSGPSTSNSVVSVLPNGHQVTIIAGPQSGSGYTWWGVRSASLGIGWVVQNYIRKI